MFSALYVSDTAMRPGPQVQLDEFAPMWLHLGGGHADEVCGVKKNHSVAYGDSPYEMGDE